MSETKEEQVQQIQKQNKKKLKLLIVFCMNFQMILFVELVGSLLIFVLRRKKEDTGVCACNGQRIHLFWGRVHRAQQRGVLVLGGEMFM